MFTLNIQIQYLYLSLLKSELLKIHNANITNIYIYNKKDNLSDHEDPLIKSYFQDLSKLNLYKSFKNIGY